MGTVEDRIALAARHVESGRRIVAKQPDLVATGSVGPEAPRYSTGVPMSDEKPEEPPLGPGKLWSVSECWPVSPQNATTQTRCGNTLR